MCTRLGPVQLRFPFPFPFSFPSPLSFSLSLLLPDDAKRGAGCETSAFGGTEKDEVTLNAS